MPKFQEGDRIRIADNAKWPASEYVGAEGHITSIRDKESGARTSTGQIPPLPPDSEWEQLYLVKLDGIPDTILAQESWLEAI